MYIHEGLFEGPVEIFHGGHINSKLPVDASTDTRGFIYIYIITWFIVFLHLAATIKEDEIQKSLGPPLESLETPIIYCYYDNKRLVFQSKTVAVIRVHHVYFWLILPEVRMDFSHFWEFSERLQVSLLEDIGKVNFA